MGNEYMGTSPPQQYGDAQKQLSQKHVERQDRRDRASRQTLEDFHRRTNFIRYKGKIVEVVS